MYDSDGLRTIHNDSFRREEDFKRAYDRGNWAYERWTKQRFAMEVQWRVHICLWAAYSASKLDGDFVECGTNRGFVASAIMEYLGWNSMNKTFYLMDTFSGLDKNLLIQEEMPRRELENKYHLDTGFFTTEVESVIENFKQWRDVVIIKGTIPETLKQVTTEEIAFLHLDMNCVLPEVAAIQYFWDNLVIGAFVLMDDYAYEGYEPQYEGLGAFARSKDVKIASLPTGQGLLIKTPPEVF